MENILDYYDINSDGTIYSKRNGRCLKLNFKKNGYVYVQLNINGNSKWYRVHRLVAQFNIPNPDNKPFVNHVDGNKSNNDVSNLEWCTGTENNKHAFLIGTSKKQYKYYDVYKDGIFITRCLGLKEVELLTGIKSQTTVKKSEIKKTRHGYTIISIERSTTSA